MRRGFAIPTVVVLIGVIAGFSHIVHVYRQNLDAVLERVLSGGDLETLALSALEEASYQLAMAHPAARSRSAGADRVAKARALGPKTAGWQGFPAPGDGATLRPPSQNHDTPRFLREGSDTLWLAPITVASTLVPDGETEIQPVAAKVLRREIGKDVKSPYAGELEPSARALAELGLPAGMEAVRITWGVLELRCEVKRKRLLATVARTVAHQKLFMVIDYTPQLEKARSYAHVFSAPLAQVVLHE